MKLMATIVTFNKINKGKTERLSCEETYSNQNRRIFTNLFLQCNCLVTLQKSFLRDIK